MRLRAPLLLAITAEAMLMPWEVLQSEGENVVFKIEKRQTYPDLTSPPRIPVTDNIVPLTKRTSTSRSAFYRHAIQEQVERTSGNGTSPSAIANLAISNGLYIVPVVVGGQSFEVILDTGSSDAWLITPNFTCIDANGYISSESECDFGPTYQSSASSTYSSLPNENMNLSYADYEFVTGTMGYDTFTLAGITVRKQEFGLINLAGWSGDGVSSGVIGFAYPILTSAFAGTNPTQDNQTSLRPYSTLFTNMWNESLTPPIFTLVLNRDPNNAGLLALGGIPNIPQSPNWYSTPIEYVGISASGPVYQYYSIAVDGYAVAPTPFVQFGPANSTNPAVIALMEPGSVIVDSGTTLVYAPNDVASAVAAAFNPPAIVDTDTGLWSVECNAYAPTFGVSVSNKVFYVNPLDMIAPDPTGKCFSGVQPSNGGICVLGDVWMKNVIVVHDIGTETMSFAAREFFGLTGP